MSEETCKECGKPVGTHIHLDENSVNTFKEIHAAAQMQHAGAEIERTRTVRTHDYNDLLDHMKSNNGHMIDYAEYRSGHEGYDDHIPGVRPKSEEYDNESDRMTHRELIAAHEHEHRKYDDMPHTTLDGEHFHH